MMEKQETSLTAEECMAFALECESSARIEQEFACRDRLFKIASAMRNIAATLEKSRRH